MLGEAETGRKCGSRRGGLVSWGGDGSGEARAMGADRRERFGAQAGAMREKGGRSDESHDE